jgi:RNA recognition motif-containing protein
MRDEQAIRAYEEKMKSKGLLQPEKAPAIPENPGNVTRLLLKNMCRKKMTKEALLEAFPQISHIVWKTDRKSGDFLGSAWVEMKTPDDAARAVAQDGHFRMFGRIMGICFQPPNPKDVWPPQGSAVV